MATTLEYVGEDHMRITRNHESVLVQTFLCPIMQGVSAFAYRRTDGVIMIVTESYTDSSGSDNPVSFKVEGMLGEAERDFDYWWDTGVPKDLPINEQVPFWAVEAYMST